MKEKIAETIQTTENASAASRPAKATVTMNLHDLEAILWSMRDVAAQHAKSKNPRIKAGARQLQTLPARLLAACGLAEQVDEKGKPRLVVIAPTKKAAKAKSQPAQHAPEAAPIEAIAEVEEVAVA